MWRVAVPTHSAPIGMTSSDHRQPTSITVASALPVPLCFDLLTSLAKMKRINSPADDNIPIYIFILPFTISLLSFLATTDFKRHNRL
jgi:hypothetical protein